MSFRISVLRTVRKLTANYSTHTNVNTIDLNSGHKLPLLGLGTWQVKPQDIKVAVKTAFDSGYRHIDSAPHYRNEKEVGIAIEEWFKTGGKREQLFVTSKLPAYGNRAEDVCKYLDRTLANLKLDYVDLYLMNMPLSLCPDEKEERVAKDGNGAVVLEKVDMFGVWKQMEAQVTRGTAKAIGVSNFNVIQFEKLFGGATIHPAVIQVEMHAYLQQPDIRLIAEKFNIRIVASSPLGTPAARKYYADKYGFVSNLPDLLKHPVVIEIAKCRQRTTAQILLIFLIQQCIPVIPRSSKAEHVKENGDIFNCRLNEEEMTRLRKLDQGALGRVINFLHFKGVELHPEYPFRRELTVIRKNMKKDV